jgi:hypothetical protein
MRPSLSLPPSLHFSFSLSRSRSRSRSLFTLLFYKGAGFSKYFNSCLSVSLYIQRETERGRKPET